MPRHQKSRRTHSCRVRRLLEIGHSKCQELDVKSPPKKANSEVEIALIIITEVITVAISLTVLRLLSGHGLHMTLAAGGYIKRTFAITRNAPQLM